MHSWDCESVLTSDWRVVCPCSRKKMNFFRFIVEHLFIKTTKSDTMTNCRYLNVVATCARLLFLCWKTHFAVKVTSHSVCVSVPSVHYNGNCCVTFTACQGSAAPARSKLTRQSKDVLGNNLKHYLWGWQLPLQWTMTSPKLRPLSIYLQQCGTSHIKAVRLVFPAPPTACS